MKHSIIIVAAMTPSGVIGQSNGLPWSVGYLKGDLARFKELTTGHTVLMGRKTYQSLPEKQRPLPNRFNMVIGTDPDWWESLSDSDQLKKFHNIPQAVLWFERSAPVSELEMLENEKKLFLIGGSGIFREGLESGIAREMFLTIAKEEFPGDIYFPEFDKNLWHSEEIAETDQYVVWRFWK